MRSQRFAGELADDTVVQSGPSALGIALGAGALLAGIWMVGFFTTANASIKSAPKLLKLVPFI